MTNDLISREALLAELAEEIEWERAQMAPITAISAFKIAIRRVKKVPAVDAEPVRHGRWYKPIGGMMPPEHHGRHRCSVCNQLAYYERPGREGLSDYCPNCGARNVEESDETD